MSTQHSTAHVKNRVLVNRGLPLLKLWPWALLINMAKQTLTGNWSLLNSKGMFAPEGIKVIRGRKTSDSLQLPVAIVTSMQLRISRTRQHRPPLWHFCCCRANCTWRCCVVRYITPKERHNNIYIYTVQVHLKPIEKQHALLCLYLVVGKWSVTCVIRSETSLVDNKVNRGVDQVECLHWLVG